MKAKINIIRERCKGCKICVEICQADVLAVSEESNNNGYFPPHVKNPDNCIYCGMCEMFCPDFAIWVTAIAQKEVVT